MPGAIDAHQPQAGRDTAAAIPGAQLVLVEGMGHDFARETWERIVSAIGAHTSKAEALPRA